MKNPANIETTRKVFAAFGQGDIPAILDLLDERVVIEFYGPGAIPYAGTWRGKAGAQRFFETVLSNVEVHVFDPEEFLADADKVVVTGHLRLTARATGAVIESDFAHVITLLDGRWLRFRDFMDTASAAAAFQG